MNHKISTYLIIASLILIFGYLVYADISPPTNLNGYNRYRISNYTEIGNNLSKLNETGLWYNDQKTFSRSYDFTICRGQNSSDDSLKIFQCDLVCLSTQTECSTTLLKANGKSVLIKEGNYPLNTSVIFTNFTSLYSDNSNTILNFSSYYNTQYLGLQFNEGGNLQGLNLIGNDSDCPLGCTKYILIKLVNSTKISTWKGNYFKEVALLFGSLSGDNSLRKTNLFVEDNVFYRPVSAINFINTIGAVARNNLINESWDTSMKIGACGIDNIFEGNTVYSYSAGSPMEMTSDGTCSPLSNNHIVNNKFYANESTFAFAIAETNSLNMSNNYYINNLISISTPNGNTNTGGIVIRSSGATIIGNKMYNLTRSGIYVLADSTPIKDVFIQGNHISDSGFLTDLGGIRINSVTGHNITNLIISGNNIRNSTRGINIGMTAGSGIYDSAINYNTILANDSCMFMTNTGNGFVNSTIIGNTCLLNKTLNNIDMTGNSYIENVIYTSVPSCTTSSLFYNKYMRNITGNFFCNGSNWVGQQDWVNIYNFPIACPAGSYVTNISSTITCTSILSIPNDLNITGNVNITGQFLVSGNFTIYGNLSLNGSLLFMANKSWDVGSINNRARAIYTQNLTVTNITGGSPIGLLSDTNIWNNISFFYGYYLPNALIVPTCDVNHRGLVISVQGGLGVADVTQECIKTALDVYAWKSVSLV